MVEPLLGRAMRNKQQPRMPQKQESKPCAFGSRISLPAHPRVKQLARQVGLVNADTEPGIGGWFR